MELVCRRVEVGQADMGIVGEQIEVGQADVRLVDDLEGDWQSEMGLAVGQV